VVGNIIFGFSGGADIAIEAGQLTLTDDALITSSTASAGRGGDIRIQVERVTLTGGAAIRSQTFGLGALGTGPGGPITITATDGIAIAGPNSGLFTGTRSRGPGGEITLHARALRLSDGGTISASSTGEGAAGTILLQVSETFRSERGRVTATAERGAGGSIQLTAGSLVQLMDSELTTVSGGGKEGNITLDSPFLVLTGSFIVANAFAGPGGNVRLETEVLLADPASRVDASGALTITGIVSPPMGTVAPLPQAFVNVAALLPARCAARWSGGKVSSLVLGGRDGLPPDPGGVLPSPLALEAQLVADPAGIATPRPPWSPARFAFLADAEKAWPRLRGAPRDLGCTP
jgi:hypothetical protein